jgi:gamma-glutamyltranspeptidase/glutathione hydrolase
VPGTIDAIITLLKLYGTKSFEEVVQPTLAILDAGGPSWYIDTGSEKRIETGVNWQADMAVTFRKLVESEKAAKGTRQQKLQAVSDRFYRGDIADALEAWYIGKGRFSSQGRFGCAQNSRGGSAQNHVPWLHGI